MHTLSRMSLSPLSAAISLALLANITHAQDLRHAAPPEMPPLAPAPATVTPPPDTPAAAPASDAPVLAALRGIVLVPDASPAALQRLAEGVDASAVPLAQTPAAAAPIRAHLQAAIGQPASLASLQRLADGISRLLREQGQPFVSVWIPPQDLTAGVVRIAVRPAVADGPVQVEGAEYFTPQSYLAHVRQTPDAPIDVAGLQADIDWINRNPFRNATLSAAPGRTPDSTQLALRVRERRPWRIFAGVDNTGTDSTDEQRVFAGFNWGNVWGRGDQLSYQYRTDPGRKRSTTHSGSYQMDLPWRHWLALSAAWSETTPDLGPVFDQKGKSWQVGAQYHVPLPRVAAADNATLTQDVYLGLDFKYSNNNLEFATIPVMDNKTHVAQMTLGYTLTRESASGIGSITPQLVFSPGKLGRYNEDAAFDGSRMGARARYTYFRLDGDYSQHLPANLRWDIRANAQYSNTPLLGSEQIAGSGVLAVRGYRESQAFGDKGVVLRNELHLPPFQWGEASLDAFVFHDAAWLRTAGADADSIRLRSAGLGAALRWGSAVSLDMSIGRQLRQDVSDEKKTRVNFRLQIAY